MSIKIKKPKKWRKGQMIFNFLEWLAYEKNMVTINRMADPFFLTDEELDEYYEEFLKTIL